MMLLKEDKVYFLWNKIAESSTYVHGNIFFIKQLIGGKRGVHDSLHP